MKKRFSLFLAAVFCLAMLTVPAMAAASDYYFEDGGSYQNGNILIDSLGEGRAIYLAPFGDQWSVSFRVDLQGGNGGDDPEANARFGLLGEDPDEGAPGDLISLTTVKTMIGRDAPDSRLEIQQLWNNSWSHLGVVEWAPHSGNAYNVTVSKRAGGNTISVTVKDTNGATILDGQGALDANAMAAAKYFGFFVYNSKVLYSNISFSGFVGGSTSTSPSNPSDPANPSSPDAVAPPTSDATTLWIAFLALGLAGAGSFILRRKLKA
ncbi:MAG: hypothetical protein FWG72_06745 [Oscillospiraceae bacterium]|nr:hypothetical protein [Oscillospiraceae bacterium]